MKVLFIFLDGVGLGKADPMSNPFMHAKTPCLSSLLNGNTLTIDASHTQSRFASLFALDACLGIEGLPQSATGQAVILTGKNVPALIGYHYGPKPNPPISSLLVTENIFFALSERKYTSSVVNAYPPIYFENINNGRRLFSAFPLAATSAGLSLKNINDLYRGNAISADFTGEGWRTQLGFPDTPLLTTHQAGKRLRNLASQSSFTLFEFWLTDVAGHRQDMQNAVALIERFDQVLEGLISTWDFTQGVILLTSDHGNLEDLSHRHHTMNPVPLLIIGSSAILESIHSVSSLMDIYPLILHFLAQG